MNTKDTTIPRLSADKQACIEYWMDRMDWMAAAKIKHLCRADFSDIRKNN